MPSLADLKIQLYADGADFAQMVALNQHPLIKGFTTNPSLLRKAGVSDYCGFAKRVLEMIPDKPISFEVLADDLAEMERQARKVATWGPHVYVKIPITTTDGTKTLPVIESLSASGVRVNVTAVMTIQHLYGLGRALRDSPGAIVSIFAGRMADTGIDPTELVKVMAYECRTHTQIQTLWASTREVWSIFQADACGCDLITLTMDQIAKLDLLGKDLTAYSRETVAQFYADGQKAGLLL